MPNTLSPNELDELARNLTEAQRRALVNIHQLGNSPYGWEASVFADSGSVAGALERRGLLMGGHIYGARTRSYRYTGQGEAVADHLRTQAQGASK